MGNQEYLNRTGVTLEAGDIEIGAVEIKDADTDNRVNVKNNSHTNHNELLINLEGHICEDNSTSTSLLADEVFEGDWQDTLDYNTITLGINSDQDSAEDGLCVCWSADGITINDTDNFTILADKPKVFTFSPARRYFKTYYTNGSTDQTTFNIQAQVKRGGFKPSSHRIKDSIVADDDAELVKSVITGLGDDGIFRNASLSESNRLKVVSQPYSYAVAEGDIPGHTSLLKFGTRTSVSAGISSLVWEGPTSTYTYMTTAQQLKIVSSSTDDIATTGTGVRSLRLYGLDGDYNEITEDIATNGTTTVTTSLSYLRIFRVESLTCGSGYTNAGTITIRNNESTTVQALINIGDGQTLMTRGS